jgi:hypothetical protein
MADKQSKPMPGKDAKTPMPGKGGKPMPGKDQGKGGGKK